MKFKTGSILKILFISLSLFWGWQSLSAAGPLTVKGVVCDQDNYPLAGASVLIEGTSIGTMADENGEFTISAEGGQVLIVSFIGFTDSRVTVTDQTQYFINLQPDTNILEEIVVVGYDTQKKVNLTGSVSMVTSDEGQSDRCRIVHIHRAVQQQTYSTVIHGSSGNRCRSDRDHRWR